MSALLRWRYRRPQTPNPAHQQQSPNPAHPQTPNLQRSNPTVSTPGSDPAHQQQSPNPAHPQTLDLHRSSPTVSTPRSGSSIAWLEPLPTLFNAFRTCPIEPDLPISRCRAPVPAMRLSQLTEVGYRCLYDSEWHNRDTCAVCLCQSFVQDPSVMRLVGVLVQLGYNATNTNDFDESGEPTTRSTSLEEWVTKGPMAHFEELDLPELPDLKTWWQLLMGIGAGALTIVQSMDLRKIAKFLLQDHREILIGLGIGTSVFAVRWFLRWFLKRDRAVDDDLEGGGGEDGGEDGPGDYGVPNEYISPPSTPTYPPESTFDIFDGTDVPQLPTDDTDQTPTNITIVDRRRTGRGRSVLQYRFRIESQLPKTDYWANVDYLEHLFGYPALAHQAIDRFEDFMATGQVVPRLPKVPTIRRT